MYIISCFRNFYLPIFNHLVNGFLTMDKCGLLVEFGACIVNFEIIPLSYSSVTFNHISNVKFAVSGMYERLLAEGRHPHLSPLSVS